MSLSYLYDPNKQFQDEAGNNNVDGFLRVYIDGTDDRAITYKDFDGTLNQSDIVLDINGRAVVIVDRSKTYRLEVYKRNGGMLWTARPIIPSSEGGGGIDPEDLKDLVIKHGGRNSGTYRPTVGATINIPKSCEAVSELEDDLYGKITSIIADFRTPVLMKSDLDPETPGVTRDFYYWPTARTGADGNYSFVGYDGVRTEIATVHEDNSVSYRTVHNGVHRLMEVWNEDSDPAPYGFWIADLEKPNPDAPCGYEWAYAHDILEGIRNGEVFVLYCYATFLIDTTTPVMHMTKIENQSGVDSLGNHYEAVRIFFDSCSYSGEPGSYAATSIYTPDKYDTSHTGRMAVLNWNGSVDKFVDFKLANDAFVEKNYNKVQSLDNNSSHYPSCPAVKEAIDTAVASAYHAAGTMSVAHLTNALLVASNQGNVYNITDSGTTTADFVDGAGHPIVAGDNVGICDVGGGVYKFDLLSGFVDLSGYLAKTGDGSDVTSTFTKASGDTSSITSGGKLSVIFTAISSFFSTIASHIANSSNPHNVTAEQTGAEPAFSILPINKGGTGKDTVNSAANNFIYNLQVTSSDITSDACEIITGDANHTTTNLLTFYKRPVSALWSYIKSKLIGSTSNVNQVDSNTETSSFTFVNGHIYHLTAHLVGSPLLINTTSSGTGYAVAYIGTMISGSHYKCRQAVEIQKGELTTKDIKLPIDWKAENITDSSDNKLHLVVVFNDTMYSFASYSNYSLTLIGTDFNGA